jgi:hypothetical protein
MHIKLPTMFHTTYYSIVLSVGDACDRSPRTVKGGRKIWQKYDGRAPDRRTEAAVALISKHLHDSSLDDADRMLGHASMSPCLHTACLCALHECLLCASCTAGVTGFIEHTHSNHGCNGGWGKEQNPDQGWTRTQGESQPEACSVGQDGHGDGGQAHGCECCLDAASLARCRATLWWRWKVLLLK